MPDILTRIKSAYAANDAAQVMNLIPELMEAVGKTVIELPCEVGSKTYIVCKHRFINTGEFRISDYDKLGKTVFLTESAARETLEVQE